MNSKYLYTVFQFSMDSWETKNEEISWSAEKLHYYNWINSEKYHI